MRVLSAQQRVSRLEREAAGHKQQADASPRVAAGRRQLRALNGRAAELQGKLTSSGPHALPATSSTSSNSNSNSNNRRRGRSKKSKRKRTTTPARCSASSS